MNHVELVFRPSKVWELFVNGYRIPDADFNVAKNASFATAKSTADTYLATADGLSRVDGSYTYTDGESVAITLITLDPTPAAFTSANNKLIKTLK